MSTVRRGRIVKDVPADRFVVALAEHFKKSDKLKVPQWAEIVKTGAYKELPPVNPDWFFIRAAAIARRVYVRPTSVGGLQKVFGGRNRRGAKRNVYALASASVIRRIMQALEEINILTKSDTKKGRFLTSNGRRELDTIATQVDLSQHDLVL